jgi:glutaredoxin/glutathione-dependent peroxiredoxin
LPPAAWPASLRGFLDTPIQVVALAAKTIAVGNQLPDAMLSYFYTSSLDDELKTMIVRDLTTAKKVVLFAMSGTFMPTCTHKHLLGSMVKVGEFHAKGIDTVACVPVNDAVGYHN